MALLEVYVDDVVIVITASAQTESATCTVIRAPTAEYTGAYTESATCTVTHEAECSMTEYVPDIDYLTGIPDSSSVQVDAEVSASMYDKMMTARFRFNGATVGTDSNFFKNVTFAIPDYAGTNNVVFVGRLISAETGYDAAGSSEVLLAHDYPWYLTMQYPADSDRVLLSIDDQADISYYQLFFDNYSYPFEAGDIIVGGTSGHSALVKEVYQMSRWLLITILSGTPDGEGDYFTDGEDLNVNGITHATADGQTVSYTVADYYPEDWVSRLLGGSEWATTTGIYPYRLTNSATMWATAQKTFKFEEKATKAACIQEVAEYMNYIFYCRWNTIAGVRRPCAYFIPEDDIDSATDGLDLPAAVTISPSSYAVVTGANYVQDGEEKYNKITVKCQSWVTDEWFTSVEQTTAVEDGDEIAIEYKEINPAIGSQAECDDRATDLYTYYQNHIKKYDLTLLKRSDLVLYQQVILNGFSQLTNGTYRIVSINYVYRDGGTTNETRITIVPNTQFKAYLNLNRTFTKTISESHKLFRYLQDMDAKIEIGTATDVTDGITALTEAGLTSISRDPTA